MNQMLHAALSTRARFLLNRDGHDSWVGRVHLGKELVLPEIYLNLDDKGTLSIEYNAVGSRTIFEETGERVVVVDSDDYVLSEIVAILGRYMVLDDLSSV